MRKLLTFPILFLFLSLVLYAGENDVNDYSLVWDSSNDDVPEDLWDITNVGDTDGDGYDEFIVCTDEDGMGIYLYECTGNDNEYQMVWSYVIPATDCNDSYVVGGGSDLDRDGLPELYAGAASGAGMYSLFIFEWTGTEGVNEYNLATSWDVNDGNGSSLCIVRHGDFDGDGVEELFLGETINDDLFIVSLDTTSSFDFPQWNIEFTEILDDADDYSPWGFVSGDFDNDGYTELACTEWDYNGLIIIQADSADAYHTEIWFNNMTYPDDGVALRSLAATDLDGDGFDELIIPSTNNHLYIVTNNGDCSQIDSSMVTDVLALGDSSFMEYLPYDIVGGALGNVDRFFGPYVPNDVYVAGYYTIADLEFTGLDYTNPNDWTFTEVRYDTSERYQSVDIGDFDNDGLDEFVVITRDNSPHILVYEKNDLDHANFNVVFEGDSSEYLYQIRGLCAGSDLDQDGKQEVFLTDYRNGGFVHGFEVVADNTLEWVWSSDTVNSNSYAPTRSVVTGDLDNDGIGEVIFPVRADAGQVDPGLRIYEWDGSTDNGYTVYASTDIDPALQNDRWRIEQIDPPYDVDGDGVNEMLIANNGSDHQVGDRFYVLSFDGTFESGFYTTTIEASWNQNDDEFGGSPWFATHGDLDGDGTQELVFAAWDHGGILLVDVTGADSYEKIGYVYTDPWLDDEVAYGGVGVADFDGDGRDEVISPFYNRYGTTILDIDGDLSSMSDADVGIIRDWYMGAGIGCSAVADFDGDGKYEFYGANYSTHAMEFSYTGDNPKDSDSWTVKSVISNMYQNSPLGFFALDAAEDLDGDGKGEIVVGYLESFNQSPQVWLQVAEYSEGEFITDNWRIITPADYKLSQNYPNPFNPITNINFEIPLDKHVELVIYDLMGHKIKTLVSKNMAKGKYTVQWDGTDDYGRRVSSGTYIYQLRAGNVVKSKRMTFIK